MAKTEARRENKLTAAVRTETGKGASRRARRAGQIPAVLYGHGSDPQHLLLAGRDFAAVLRHTGTNAVLTLDIDGKEQLALTKSLEIHPIRRNIQLLPIAPPSCLPKNQSFETIPAARSMRRIRRNSGQWPATSRSRWPKPTRPAARHDVNARSRGSRMARTPYAGARAISAPSTQGC